MGQPARPGPPPPLAPVSGLLAALRRVEAAGARPITAIAFASEIMRDWARPDSDKLRALFGWYFPKKAELDKAEGII